MRSFRYKASKLAHEDLSGPQEQHCLTHWWRSKEGGRVLLSHTPANNDIANVIIEVESIEGH